MKSTRPVKSRSSAVSALLACVTRVASPGESAPHELGDLDTAHTTFFRELFS